MIGIMADSHDNVRSIKLAVSLFKEAGCNLVIHAGDFVAPFAARELANLSCPVKAVFGNCDGEKKGLEKVFHSFGEIKKAPFVFCHENLNFLVTHIPAARRSYPHLVTHIPAARRSYPHSEKHDVIIFAHTHKPEVRREKNTLLINPGEAGGWVSGKSTVALLDPTNLSVDIITL
jgi:putative phosphoesterase